MANQPGPTLPARAERPTYSTSSSLLEASQRSNSPPPSPYTASSPSFPSPSRSVEVEPGVREAVPSAGAGVASGGAGGPLRRASEEPRRDGKADQIVQHFFAKACAVVTQARLTQLEDTTALPPTSAASTAARRGAPRRTPSTASGSKRTNKWFNLELPETDLFRSELKTWRSVSSLPSPSSIPPMVLDILLDTADLTPNQVLVLSAPTGQRIRVDAQSSGIASPRVQRTNVILERWTLQLVPPFPAVPPELPSVYKQAIILFRSLFTLVRTLPAWGLYRRLVRRRAGGNGGELRIVGRMGTGEGREGEMGVEARIGESEGEKTTETVVWPAVQTPIGSLTLQCTYRLNADFSVEDIETLLSSRFIDEDFFKPTMARYQHEQDAASGRPGSLPTSARNLPTTSGTPPTGRPSYGSLSSRHHLSVPFPSISSTVDPSRIPLPQGGTSPLGNLVATPPESASSGGRYGSYGGGVEPAFVSLSRARGASYTGGIQRTIPLSSSPSSQPIRPGFASGSPSSSSPIFRASSYISSPPQPSSGPTSNINRLSSSRPSIPSSISFGTRSPLAPPLPNVASGIASAAPRPIPSPSGTQPMRSYSGGSYSRSYGRASSGGSVSGGEASGNWGGPESLGRRGGRLSFDGRQRPTFTSLPEGVATSDERKVFLPQVVDDSDDINSFLGMIDSRPELQRTEGMGASMIVSKSQADQTLKKLAGSVYAPQGGSPTEYSPRTASNLLRGPSRLSIEEEPPLQRSASNPDPPPTARFVRRTDMATTPSDPPSPAPYFIPPPASPLPNPLSFPRYIPRTHGTVTTGFDLGHSAAASAAASIASLSGGEGSATEPSRSYGGEEEAVGELELGDEEADERGRQWVDAPEVPSEGRARSRDKTPGRKPVGRRFGVGAQGYFGEGRGDGGQWRG